MKILVGKGVKKRKMADVKCSEYGKMNDNSLFVTPEKSSKKVIVHIYSISYFWPSYCSYWQKTTI